MTDFPKMLYAKGDTDDTEIFGLHCRTLVVEDELEQEAALAGEWRHSPHEAHGKQPVQPKPELDMQALNDSGAADPELLDERNALLDEVMQLREENAKLRTDLQAERDTVKADPTIEALSADLSAANGRVAMLEEELAQLRGQVAKFDGDSNGEVGGTRPRGRPRKVPEEA